ncbi:thiamine pyrophosphate-dependent enzyme, possible carboligase or decarboxylase [Hoeflea sp. IMCC20628]|uniref:5-guanidino-2-oxopentanoate decarboxylase n=1 Tax=Hoeflea sp. IMCC20628 TaxID=1620421 RepID=UPI00063ADD1C|nr:5-guanidino-2-oxopentanoate decarboxylase [Hoeflea sp. IMCC20628]AKI01657.1 thiamine pyrophosphate-dependent enzyme, possible carboligase or decarboxylase [Hoeflea sp. IMCC20628]
MHDRPMTVGEALVVMLEQAGVDTVFGIPGVHTIELYRGLADSAIRHITPRHEQGAGFMADGYARVTGRPGVCIVITGPGLTNTLTAMAQARADSIPMLVISGVNATATLGNGRGHLHELPDQSGLVSTVALRSFTLTDPAQLSDVLAQAFAVMTSGRPGPVHIEIPTDIMKLPAGKQTFTMPLNPRPNPSAADLATAQRMCADAKMPVILIGGGAVAHASAVRNFAQALDAPVISTTNSRGIMAGHDLDLPASPSLACVRDLLMTADLVLALGTELGPTDCDMYEDGGFTLPKNLIRVDIDSAQLARGPLPALPVTADLGSFLDNMLSNRDAWARKSTGDGAKRSKAVRELALAEIGETYGSHIDLCHEIWRAMPDATLVGDSTQLIYAGNMYVEAPRETAWFNSATGFGTLGYAAPAAIGAALGQPGRPAVALLGDGGFQFTLAELGSARDCNADVAFLVWNNSGYMEIETSMVSASIAPIGVTPSAPDFSIVASAYGLPSRRVASQDELIAALKELPRPCLIEYLAPR